MAVVLGFCAPVGLAQRVQFPSMISEAPPAVTAPPAYGSPPPASFGGTIQPAPTWDPYSNTTAPPPSSMPYYVQPQPGVAGQPPALFPEGMPWSQGSGSYLLEQPGQVMSQYQRFLQEVQFDYTWLAPIGGANRFGVNTLELYASFAFPIFYNKESPLVVTPGFAVHFLEGPVSNGVGTADLPPRLYDAYLDFAWKPRVSPWLGGDLGLRTGVYSDFETFDSASLRLMGRALGVLTFTPDLQIALGIVYLDRNKVKLLPAGGVIWTPTPDRRYEIIFPYPKLAKRLRDIGTTQWWCYLAGEYGGGAWTVERAITGVTDSIDYNDIRVILGFDWIALSGMRGFIETGYVFDREIIFTKAPPPEFEPDDTVMLRAGVAF